MLDVEIFPQPDGKNHNKRGKHRAPQGSACSASDNGSVVRAWHQLLVEALFCAFGDNKSVSQNWINFDDLLTGTYSSSSKLFHCSTQVLDIVAYTFPF